VLKDKRTGYRTKYSGDRETGIISLRKTVILLIITTILLIGYVWTRIKAIELTYIYTKLCSQERILLEQNYKLRLEIASLKSPERLTSLALKKLNFKKNLNMNKIFVKIEDRN